ncbi:hypothetical protein SCATT_15480 [Streptantibioticus cattleyicolor NRRL 8057 = DSM 46488]|uniref:Uncharacterized protein n=1 Tax=Streptantibioticus cattleyicolor (strain ATCC 35852 / DSM 46488 / JCM 4925 / NBRC 14057 / NRRL 8057) TaxID=1003195 RepID=G8X233_STREN|nr:hypothetical protein SCATT_15480 [Streptantibioticus cattleyicolor NRRL 8057 = DSM 46488]
MGNQPEHRKPSEIDDPTVTAHQPQGCAVKGAFGHVRLVSRALLRAPRVTRP